MLYRREIGDGMTRLYHFLDRHPLISGPLLGLAFGGIYVIINTSGILK